MKIQGVEQKDNLNIQISLYHSKLQYISLWSTSKLVHASTKKNLGTVLVDARPFHKHHNYCISHCDNKQHVHQAKTIMSLRVMSAEGDRFESIASMCNVVLSRNEQNCVACKVERKKKMC